MTSRLLYIGQWRDPKGQHATISQYCIGKALEALCHSSISVRFIVRDPLPSIIDAIRDASYSHIVVTQHVLTVRLPCRKAIRRAVKCRDRCTKILFIDDVVGHLWWKDAAWFDEFWGTQFFPDSFYISHIKTFWPKQLNPSIPCTWIPPFFPSFCSLFDTKTRDTKRTPRIIFPSRDLSHHYPERKAWYGWLQTSKVGPLVDLCTASHGKLGPSFLRHLSTYRACLVVVPRSGYIIRKFFECFATKTLVIGVFCEVGDEKPDPCRRATLKGLEALGFLPGTHFLTGNAKTLDSIHQEDLESGKYQTMVEAAFEQAVSHHTLAHRCNQIIQMMKFK